MPLVDNARRWLRDRFAGDDGITVHPKVGLREVEANLANMTPAERQRNIQHVRAYASLYYQGRHNEFTPDDVVQTINRMDARAQRLDGVDRARQIVNEYGGPPSRQTVMDALDRSHQERLREHGKETPEVAPTPVKAARE